MNTTHRAPLRALSATEIVTRLTELNGAAPQGWRLIDGALEKTFRFADFHRTMAFVNALAFIAHQRDHHPDLQLSYGHCTVRWHTHDVSGISAKDFACATEVDALGA
jgi:4a-hydroxytetrahydrobiopterin dehydratase